ncbi:hypothetical protein AOLI_G00182900 [Acnodon oligacanthus]
MQSQPRAIPEHCSSPARDGEGNIALRSRSAQRPPLPQSQRPAAPIYLWSGLGLSDICARTGVFISSCQGSGAQAGLLRCAWTGRHNQILTLAVTTPTEGVVSDQRKRKANSNNISVWSTSVPKQTTVIRSEACADKDLCCSA